MIFGTNILETAGHQTTI